MNQPLLDSFGRVLFPGVSGDLFAAKVLGSGDGK